MSSITKDEWKKHQHFEQDWHGNCLHTLGEELKQTAYAKKMGLDPVWRGGQWPWYDFEQKVVIDIGGGPSSILLKGFNLQGAIVTDPCQFPDWVIKRYQDNGIGFQRKPAEELELPRPGEERFDIALCYNVLQHTMDPAKIILNMRNLAKEIRMFEWIDTEVTEGHPHVLTEDSLRYWLGANGDEGARGYINEQGATGFYFAGVFKT